MQNATTVRVSTETRDAVRMLAQDDGLTLNQEIQRLARAERQRRIGAALSSDRLEDEDARWLGLGVDTVSSHARR